MNDQTVDRFEAELTEILGAMKQLFGEFERRLGEAVSAQRLASSEARAEAADARAILRKLVQRAEETADGQRQALAMLREKWWFNIEQNAKASGAGMAQEFGEKIAAGLEKRLKALSADVESVTRRFQWVTALKWGAGVGAGIVFVIALGVNALTPQADGISSQQLQAAVAELVPCQLEKERHICVRLDDKPQLSKLQGGTPVAVVRGL
jgi:hypothetical protein